MLESALKLCPDRLWGAYMWKDPKMPAEFSAFWYVAYHALFWLDLYLSGRVEGFTPPLPFTLSEYNPQGELPERVYTRSELLAYLAYCRKKCQDTIEQLTNPRASRLCKFTWVPNGISFSELLLDNMRHVQEHGAQLNMFLGQHGGVSADWDNWAKEDKTHI